MSLPDYDLTGDYDAIGVYPHYVGEAGKRDRENAHNPYTVFVKVEGENVSGRLDVLQAATTGIAMDTDDFWRENGIKSPKTAFVRTIVAGETAWAASDMPHGGLYVPRGHSED